MNRILVLVILLAGLSTLAAGQKVHVEYDRTADFSQFRTYAWAAQSQFPPDTALGLFDARFKKAVDARMKQSGFTLADDPKAAGLELAYFVIVDPMSSTQSVNPNDPTAKTKFEQTWVTSELEGTLDFTMRDVKADKRVWLARSVTRVEPKKQEKNIQKILDKFFKNFPPGR